MASTFWRVTGGWVAALAALGTLYGCSSSSGSSGGPCGPLQTCCFSINDQAERDTCLNEAEKASKTQAPFDSCNALHDQYKASGQCSGSSSGGTGQQGGAGGTGPQGGAGGTAMGGAGGAPMGGAGGTPMGGAGGTPMGGAGGTPMGGAGGTPMGGAGGTPMGGAGGTGGAATCGGQTCQGESITNPFPIELPGCCTDTDRCGVDFSPLQPLLMVVPSGCAERDAPGQQTSACEEVPGGITPLPGCCRPNGQCGVIVDLSNVTFMGSTYDLGSYGCQPPEDWGASPTGSCTP